MASFCASVNTKIHDLLHTLGSSLRSRLVLLVLIAVGPGFALILHNAERHRQLTSSQVKVNALAAARAIASEQDRLLENAHQFLVTLARVPQISANDRAACHQVLSGLLEPIYLDLAVTDVKGRLLCGALAPANAIASGVGRHHERTVETQDFSLGDLRVQPSSGKIILDLGYPVSDVPGRLRAVLTAALDLDWLTRLTVDSRLY